MWPSFNKLETKLLDSPTVPADRRPGGIINKEGKLFSQHGLNSVLKWGTDLRFYLVLDNINAISFFQSVTVRTFASDAALTCRRRRQEAIGISGLGNFAIPPVDNLPSRVVGLKTSLRIAITYAYWDSYSLQIHITMHLVRKLCKTTFL